MSDPHLLAAVLGSAAARLDRELSHGRLIHSSKQGAYYSLQDGPDHVVTIVHGDRTLRSVFVGINGSSLT